MYVGAVNAPTIRRSSHANGHNHRSRYRKIGVSGARQFGIVAPVGRKGVEQLLAAAGDASNPRVPEVARAFSLSRKPWIDVNAASAAAIIEQVKRCPSGALSYELLEKT